MWRAGTVVSQPRQALGIEERFALVRRTGNEHEQLAIAVEGHVEPLAGSAAVGIGQDRCALKHVGLLQIVLRHGDAPGGSARVKSGHLRRVAAQREGERFGNGFARQVVFRGAEAAHDDQNVDARQARCGWR